MAVWQHVKKYKCIYSLPEKSILQNSLQIHLYTLTAEVWKQHKSTVGIWLNKIWHIYKWDVLQL